MQFENEIKQTIECDTFADCKAKLYERYGNDYKIENKETKLKHVGLFGLRQKEVTVVTYTVPHKKVYVFLFMPENAILVSVTMLHPPLSSFTPIFSASGENLRLSA